MEVIITGGVVSWAEWFAREKYITKIKKHSNTDFFLSECNAFSFSLLMIFIIYNMNHHLH